MRAGTKNFYDSPLNGSNSLNINTRRYYGTLSYNKHKIDDLQVSPWFITGFSEAEGCFSCSVLKSSSYKLGWEVQLNFQIKLHVRDFPLLLGIQHSLGGIGIISSNQSSCTFFLCAAHKKKSKKIKWDNRINKIFWKISFNFSKKRRLFKQIVSIMQLKEHITLEGLQKIVNIRATLNFGLSKELQLMFPETIPVSRPSFYAQRFFFIYIKYK